MRAAAVVLVLAVAIATPARALEEVEGTRAQGMGGATRAWAVGGTGPLLNPSGMSLVKSYNVEASFLYASRFSGQYLHASIVDSTSALNVAGGIYYTYRLDKPAAISGHAQEAGAALALPFGAHVALGLTGKWLSLHGQDQGLVTSTGGLTFDAGLTVRPNPHLSLALVAANLRDLHTSRAPQNVSYGVALVPVNELIIALDGVTSFTAEDTLGFKGTGVRAGAELTLAQRVALRLGGGTDPMLGVGYLAAGASVIGELGAIDIGARGDLFPMKTGSSQNVFLGVSLRLFVPGAVETATAASAP